MWQKSKSWLSSPAPTSPLASGLPALYTIAFLSGISVGLFNPLISALMAEKGVGPLWIGANSTVYFLVMASGTPLVPKLLKGLGLRRTMMVGLGLMGLTAPLFPLTDNLGLWFAIRAGMGLAACLYLVSGQAGLNYFCHPQNRALVSGLQALSLSFGLGLGPILGGMLYRISPLLTFTLGGGIILSGIGVVAIGLPERVLAFAASDASQLRGKLRLPLQGAFVYGFTVSTLVSLYPVYLLRQAYTIEEMSYALSLFVVGSLVATVPFTHWADLWGKMKVLKICTGIAACSLLSISFFSGGLAVKILALITGVGVSPIFPLSLSLIGEKVGEQKLSAGSALFTATYGYGCTAGPLFSGLAMQVLGEQTIFGASFGIFVVFLNNLSKVNSNDFNFSN
jgi:MFS family permease